MIDETDARALGSVDGLVGAGSPAEPSGAGVGEQALTSSAEKPPPPFRRQTMTLLVFNSHPVNLTVEPFSSGVTRAPARSNLTVGNA